MQIRLFLRRTYRGVYATWCLRRRSRGVYAEDISVSTPHILWCLRRRSPGVCAAHLVVSTPHISWYMRRTSRGVDGARLVACLRRGRAGLPVGAGAGVVAVVVRGAALAALLLDVAAQVELKPKP
jgi:hypothetical protein